VKDKCVISSLGEWGQMGLLEGCSNKIIGTTRAAKACYESPNMAESKCRNLTRTL
jgi:hypothetical protein